MAVVKAAWSCSRHVASKLPRSAISLVRIGSAVCKSDGSKLKFLPTSKTAFAALVLFSAVPPTSGASDSVCVSSSIFFLPLNFIETSITSFLCLLGLLECCIGLFECHSNVGDGFLCLLKGCSFTCSLRLCLFRSCFALALCRSQLGK